MTATFRMLLLSASCTLLASCEFLKEFRENKTFITCHMQTDEVEHPRELMPLPVGGQTINFKKVPEFSQRYIAAFEPFPAEDGQGNGLVLQLDAKGRNALENATRMHKGMAMITMVNAVPVDMIEIDQPIVDGRFVIWRGVSDETIAEMDKFYTRINRLKSMSRWMEMSPSTDKEKADVYRQAKEAAKAEAKAQRDRERNIQRASKIKEIPMEGVSLPGF